MDRSSGAQQLLSGIRIISFTQFFLGPVAAQYLADMGAEVVKVEPPSGAWERQWAPGGAWPGGVSALFLIGSRNIRSVALDLKSAEGLAAARKLIATADVLVQNFRPGVMDRLGLGYEAVQEVNPRIIYASGSAYGTDGEFSTLPGQDILLQAESGLAWISGRRGEPPVPSGAPIVDTHSGTLLALGIAGALVQRERTGRGEKVDVKMLNAAIDLQAEPMATFLNGGRVELPGVALGSPYGSAPYGIYPTAAGYLCLSQSPLADVLAAMGHPEELSDLEGIENTFEVREHVYTRLCEGFKGQTASEWVTQLRAHGVWCAPVVEYADLADNPVVASVKPFASVTHPRAGEVTLPAHPIFYGSGDSKVASVAPDVGQDTREMLLEVGYRNEEIDQMVANGAATCA